MKELCIIGFGIAGLATAIELSKQNYKISILDKHSLKQNGKNNFLSFNFTINYRGRKALENLGLWSEVEKKVVPLYSRIIHSKKYVREQRYSGNSGHVLYSIPRTILLDILYSKAKSIKNIFIDELIEVSDIKINEKDVSIYYSRDGELKEKKADFIIAADGANSFVRKKFHTNFLPDMRHFRWGYIELKILNDELSLIKHYRKNSLHIWSGSDFLCVGIPNQDSSVSLLYLANRFNKNIENDVECFIKKARKDIISNIGNIESLKSLSGCKKIGYLASVKCLDWFIEDKVVLIGDAAHAVWPFYGQGMNAALQDACTLNELLKVYTVREAFLRFYKTRKPCMDIISKLSMEHFYFLKDGTHSIWHNAAYKLDLDLSNKLPKFWCHEYSMLSNTCANISAIYRKLKRQKWLKFNPLYGVAFFYYITKEIVNNCRGKIYE